MDGGQPRPHLFARLGLKGHVTNNLRRKDTTYPQRDRELPARWAQDGFSSSLAKSLELKDDVPRVWKEGDPRFHDLLVTILAEVPGGEQHFSTALLGVCIPGHFPPKPPSEVVSHFLPERALTYMSISF